MKKIVQSVFFKKFFTIEVNFIRDVIDTCTISLLIMDSEPEYGDCELDSPDLMGSEAIPDSKKSIEEQS